MHVRRAKKRDIVGTSCGSRLNMSLGPRVRSGLINPCLPETFGRRNCFPNKVVATYRVHNQKNCFPNWFGMNFSRNGKLAYWSMRSIASCLLRTQRLECKAAIEGRFLGRHNNKWIPHCTASQGCQMPTFKQVRLISTNDLLSSVRGKLWPWDAVKERLNSGLLQSVEKWRGISLRDTSMGSPTRIIHFLKKASVTPQLQSNCSCEAPLHLTSCPASSHPCFK